LPHNGHILCCRIVNAAPISGRFEVVLLPLLLGSALRQLALPRDKGVAAIQWSGDCATMPIEDWQLHYSRLFDAIGAALDFDCDPDV